MGELGSGIFINILSSAVWVVCGILLVKLYGAYAARRETIFNRLAQMPYDVEHVHLTYGLIGSDAASRAALEGDVSAICSALTMLQDRFGTEKVSVLSPAAALSNFGTIDNLVSVSGPLYNPITRALLEASAIAVSFQVEDNDDVLVDQVANTLTHYKTIRESNIPRECYALVYRGSRETSAHWKKRHFVVAAGISPLGTYGAVTWLRKCSTQRLKDDPFVQRLKKDEHALIILKVRDSSPIGFQAYGAGPDSPGFLNVEVIARYRTEHIKHRPSFPWTQHPSQKTFPQVIGGKA